MSERSEDGAGRRGSGVPDLVLGTVTPLSSLLKPWMPGGARENPIPGKAQTGLAGAPWEAGKLVPRTHNP